MTCQHTDFRAQVDVTRLVTDLDLPPEALEAHTFMADVRVWCADCGGAFGFRGPPAGVSWREPRVQIDALTILLPLMSPAELALAGPLPAMSRGPMLYEAAP